MTGKKKESSKVRKIYNFFVRVFCGIEDTNPVGERSNSDEASDEIVNRQVVAQKEVLGDVSRGINDPKESRKDFQGKDEKNLFVIREDDTREHINTTFKKDRRRRSSGNSVQNRNSQNRSKSAEGLHSARSKSPKPCTFKTEDGGLFCEVCSWTSPNGTLGFINHCNTRRHRERMKDRFNSEEDISRIAEMKKWISELGLILIEPDSESFLRCNLCNKVFPAGKCLETFLVNIEIHVEGKGHVNKLDQVLTMSNSVADLITKIQKSPTGKIPNLNF